MKDLKCLRPGYFQSINWPPGFTPSAYEPPRDYTAVKENLKRGRDLANAISKANRFAKSASR